VTLHKQRFPRKVLSVPQRTFFSGVPGFYEVGQMLWMMYSAGDGCRMGLRNSWVRLRAVGSAGNLVF
jgi:hypothetical protein